MTCGVYSLFLVSESCIVYSTYPLNPMGIQHKTEVVASVKIALRTANITQYPLTNNYLFNSFLMFFLRFIPILFLLHALSSHLTLQSILDCLYTIRGDIVSAAKLMRFIMRCTLSPEAQAPRTKKVTSSNQMKQRLTQHGHGCLLLVSCLSTDKDDGLHYWRNCA